MSVINKQVSTTVPATVSTMVSVTTDIKWILSVDEPEAPVGYTRAADLDLDLGLAGKWWAFLMIN